MQEVHVAVSGRNQTACFGRTTAFKVLYESYEELRVASHWKLLYRVLVLLWRGMGEIESVMLFPLHIKM